MGYSCALHSANQYRRWDSSTHFRPEVLHKVKNTSDDLVHKVQEEVEDEKAGGEKT